MAGGTWKAVHVEEAKMAPEKVKNASREGGKGVWNRQGQVTLRVANPVVVSTDYVLESRALPNNKYAIAKREDGIEVGGY